MSMTLDQWINHVENSIAMALRHQSYIDESVLKIRGFSTGVMRRLISNLCHLPNNEQVVYTEAGLFGGGSICSAMNNNPNAIIYGIDDGSQPFGDPEILNHLRENLGKYWLHAKKVHVYEEDFFKMDLGLIDNPVDIFFYVAVHSQEAQRQAWSHFEHKLADVALVIVDDARWISVINGTREGIADIASKRRIVKEWILDDGVNNSPVWWNGMLLALTERIK